MTHHTKNLKRTAESGVGMVEFAILAPIVFLIIVAIVSLGITIYRIAAMQQALNAGGQYITKNPVLLATILEETTPNSALARVNVETYVLSSNTFAGMTGIDKDTMLLSGVTDPMSLDVHVAILLPGWSVEFFNPDSSITTVAHPLSSAPSTANISSVIMLAARIKAISFFGWSFNYTVVSTHLT